MSEDLQSMTFEQWIAQVDKIIVNKFGVSYQDLPDWTWMDAFEDNMSPKDAAETFVEELTESGDL